MARMSHTEGDVSIMRVRNRDSEEQFASPPAKRPKIALACEECRARKVRCDGVQPVCGACSRRRKGVPNCTYQPERSKDGVSIGYVIKLESRLHQLEALAKQGNTEQRRSGSRTADGSDSTPRSTQHAPYAPRIAHSPSLDPRQSGTHVSSAGQLHLLSPESAPVDRDDHEEQQATPSEPSEVNDGMGNTGTTEGSSSAAGFMKQIRDAVSAKLSLPENITERSGRHYFDAIHAPSKDLNSWALSRLVAEHCVLPARINADRMLEVYWREVHILYPFIHQQQFLQAYESLWTSESRKVDNRMVYCILNVIFALCCQVTKKQAVEDQEASADVFFQRALQLLQIDVIGAGSLSLIQALLLVSQYLQSSDWPHRCWAAVGMAVRVAQGLGLHLPETTVRIPNQRDRELARRLWHGCVFMDRMAAMTLGRPMMVSRNDAVLVPFPCSIDDEYLDSQPGHDNRQPADQPSTTAFFVSSVELYAITERVLSTMYASGSVNGSSPRSGLPFPEQLESLDFNEILRLDGALIKWNDSLPAFLTPKPGALIDVRQDPIFPRQANILRLRYLHLQILLFRPLLSLLLFSEFRTISSCSDGGLRLWLPQAMALPCAKKCVFAAQQVIDIVYENQIDDNDIDSIEALPVWWYQVFFVYTAATALIPARMYAHIRDDIPESSLLTSWECALHILRRLCSLSSSARRCLAALELVNDKIARDSNTHVDTTTKAPIPERASYDDNEGVTEVPQMVPSAMSAAFPYQSQGMDFLSFMPTFEQDSTWLDSISLPTDLLNIGYGEFSELYSGV